MVKLTFLILFTAIVMAGLIGCDRWVEFQFTPVQPPEHYSFVLLDEITLAEQSTGHTQSPLAGVTLEEIAAEYLSPIVADALTIRRVEVMMLQRFSVFTLEIENRLSKGMALDPSQIVLDYVGRRGYRGEAGPSHQTVDYLLAQRDGEIDAYMGARALSRHPALFGVDGRTNRSQLSRYFMPYGLAERRPDPFKPQVIEPGDTMRFTSYFLRRSFLDVDRATLLFPLNIEGIDDAGYYVRVGMRRTTLNTTLKRLPGDRS